MKNPEVIVLKLDCSSVKRGPIHPVVLCDEYDRILVDCGYPGFLPMLERETAFAGFEFGEFTGVVITHPDDDHYGALYEIKEKYPHIRTMSSEFDAPYVEGKIPHFRISTGSEKFASFTDEMKEEVLRYRERLEKIKPIRIDGVLRDGDVRPWCGGTKIVSTPGHMPGHISLYVVPMKTLIAGDALISTYGKLRISNPRYATHPREAERSAETLLAMDVEKYVCYHGGTVIRYPDGNLRFNPGITE